MQFGEVFEIQISQRTVFARHNILVTVVTIVGQIMERAHKKHRTEQVFANQFSMDEAIRCFSVLKEFYIA